MAQSTFSLLMFLSFLLNLFYSSSGQSLVARVNEPATFSCDYDIPKKEIANYRVYWQKSEKVVRTYVHGKKSEELFHSPFVNRTTPIDLLKNLSVTILSLQVADEGIYECIVQKMVGGQYKRVHKHDVKLSIRADFSDPIIKVNEEELPFPTWRITCSSSNGYPQPNLIWLSNGKELTSLNITIFQDPTTKLYDIKSELHVNQSNNFSLTCLIKYGDFQVSTNNTLRKDPVTVPTFQPLIIASILISICFSLIALILCLNRFHCQFCKQPEDGLYSDAERSTVAATEEEANELVNRLTHVESAATSDKAASV
ncbi:T-lymphocyte activation antigen CD80 [Antechinus flavipes]|uniref:T-lymphocyte activation antigen CD80 n=1 Tax=Antechinus flavipes TaxID=38775 RepID=UPI002235C667|nr:T-lymphocyte activation antigen CD80 [Antechinus flavipes]XP_051841301.1 T-lymphocyte activation antigen CD80 [Antechinus flavipes]